MQVEKKDGYTIIDRRGQEPCRVCGCKTECHSEHYGKPTLECIKYLRSELEQVPKIKPLVWEDDEFGGSDAFSSIITYTIIRTEEDDKDKPYIVNWCDGWKTFELLSEAKAWCQNEYERRVLECLE